MGRYYKNIKTNMTSWNFKIIYLSYDNTSWYIKFGNFVVQGNETYIVI